MKLISQVHMQINDIYYLVSQVYYKIRICLCSSQTPICLMCEVSFFIIFSPLNRIITCLGNIRNFSRLLRYNTNGLSVFAFRLVRSHPALVNAIILILHSVTSSMPGQSNASSSHNTPASSYSEMPGQYRPSVKHMGSEVASNTSCGIRRVVLL